MVPETFVLYSMTPTVVISGSSSKPLSPADTRTGWKYEPFADSIMMAT